MIPLSIPNFEGNEKKYVEDAVSQGWVSTGGAYVDKFEDMVAEYACVPGAVACQSGTAALHLSLIQCGVGIEDIVIVPTLTFIAAVNPVRYVHAVPIFMDCDDSLCMDPDKLRRFCQEECQLTKGGLIHRASQKHIKAVIVVHVFGNLADMESIMEISEEFHLKVIEDATEALGSYYDSGKYNGKMAGSIGDFGAYSFNGNKIITTGGGGMIVSQDESALQHLKYLSTQAKDDPYFYLHNEVGFNYRMTNVQAAIGVAQMEMLEEFIKRKNENYQVYCELLDNVERFQLLRFRSVCRTNKWFYSLVINMETCEQDIRTYIYELQCRGIQTRPIWGLIHEQPPYKKYLSYMIDKAKHFSTCIINLPCSTNLTNENIKTVCKNIKSLKE